MLGNSEVTEEGTIDRELDGITLLFIVGADDGKVEGVEEGSTEGTLDGWIDGYDDGLNVEGRSVPNDGIDDGLNEGCLVVGW